MNTELLFNEFCADMLYKSPDLVFIHDLMKPYKNLLYCEFIDSSFEACG